jgi:hypothetical protein
MSVCIRGLGVSVLWVVVCLVCAVPAQGQLHYDPYLVLPNKVGAVGVYTGLANENLSALNGRSDLYGMVKYAPLGNLEIGGRLDLGYWRRGVDTIGGASLGAKYLLHDEIDALSANVLLPMGKVGDWGLALGYMRTVYWGLGFGLSAWGQAGVLRGYAAEGLVFDGLVQLYWSAAQRLNVFLDLGLVGGSSDFFDVLALELGPNVDLMLGENAALNLGLDLVLGGEDGGAGATVALLLSR